MTGPGKLIRDRVPELLRGAGSTANIRRLSVDERLPALLGKLREEADELRNAADLAEQAEELADVYEVLLAIAAHLGLPWTEIDRLAAAKRVERGGFSQGLWLSMP